MDFVSFPKTRQKVGHGQLCPEIRMRPRREGKDPLLQVKPVQTGRVSPEVDDDPCRAGGLGPLPLHALMDNAGSRPLWGIRMRRRDA